MAERCLYQPVTIGSRKLPGNLFLAPVAGYTDWAFRSLCVEQGANLTCTELISAEALIRSPAGRRAEAQLAAQFAAQVAADFGKTGALLRRASNERCYAIQLFGAEPGQMYRAARLLAPYKPEIVDINAGCPVPKVIKAGAGAALTRDPERLGKITAAVARASAEALGNAPVTVKIRSGWDSTSLTYLEAAWAAVENGAAMVTLHPRTRAQGYQGASDWPLIACLASRLPVPVAGSGDLFTPEDARKMLWETGCAAVMFARGALGNPFIFSATHSLLTTGTYDAPDPAERIAAGLRHLECLAATLGERSACLEMRKQFHAYTKALPNGPGLPGGAALRDKLAHAETIAQYRAILGHSH